MCRRRSAHRPAGPCPADPRGSSVPKPGGGMRRLARLDAGDERRVRASVVARRCPAIERVARPRRIAREPHRSAWDDRGPRRWSRGARATRGGGADVRPSGDRARPRRRRDRRRATATHPSRRRVSRAALDAGSRPRHASTRSHRGCARFGDEGVDGLPVGPRRIGGARQRGAAGRSTRRPRRPGAAHLRWVDDVAIVRPRSRGRGRGALRCAPPRPGRRSASSRTTGRPSVRRPGAPVTRRARATSDPRLGALRAAIIAAP